MAVDCIFSKNKFINGCAVLNDNVTCVPSRCKWRHTEETYFASLEKAMQNYHKATGLGDYMSTQTALSTEVKKRFAEYLAKKGSTANKQQS